MLKGAWKSWTCKFLLPLMLIGALAFPKKAKADSVNYFDINLPNLAMVENLKNAGENFNMMKGYLNNIFSGAESRKNNNIQNINIKAGENAPGNYNNYNMQGIMNQLLDLKKNLAGFQDYFIIDPENGTIKSNISEKAGILNSSIKSFGCFSTFTSAKADADFSFNFLSNLGHDDQKGLEACREYMKNGVSSANSDIGSLFKSLNFQGNVDSLLRINIEQSSGFKTDMKNFSLSYCEKNSTLEEKIYRGSASVSASGANYEFSQTEKKEKTRERKIFLERTSKINRIGYYALVGVSGLERQTEENQKIMNNDGEKEENLIIEESVLSPILGYRVSYDLSYFTPFIRKDSYGTCMKTENFNASIDTNGRKNFLFCFSPSSNKKLLEDYLLKKEDISYGISETKKAELFSLEHMLFSSADGIILFADNEKQGFGLLRKGYGLVFSNDNTRLILKNFSISFSKKDDNYSLGTSLFAKNTDFSFDISKIQEEYKADLAFKTLF